MPHAHPPKQVMVVLSGKLRVRFEEQVAELGPGQAFLAAPNIGHHVTALMDTRVLSVKDMVPFDPYPVADWST